MMNYAAMVSIWQPLGVFQSGLRGKVTARRSHNRKAGQKALYLVPAFATNRRLVLGEEAVNEKSNESKAIPACGVP
jgi:hypothetical protein